MPQFATMRHWTRAQNWISSSTAEKKHDSRPAWCLVEGQRSKKDKYWGFVTYSLAPCPRGHGSGFSAGGGGWGLVFRKRLVFGCLQFAARDGYEHRRYCRHRQGVSKNTFDVAEYLALVLIGGRSLSAYQLSRRSQSYGLIYIGTTLVSGQRGSTL